MDRPTPGEPPTPDEAPPSEPEAETARVPIEPPPTRPTPGIISAEPVGWRQEPTWTPPAAGVAAPTTEGLVISRVFPRLVAYAIDYSLLGAVNIAVVSAAGLFAEDADPTTALIVAIGLTTLDLLYFVLLWTSAWHATLGMRLMQLQVLGAVDAGRLSLNDALLRWLALTGAIAILALVPSIAGTVGFLSVVWLLVLLVTTAMHPLRQGLHDRWARSVIVQPAPGGSGLAFVGCLVLTVVFVVILPLAMVALLGDQIRDLLTEIGESV